MAKLKKPLTKKLVKLEADVTCRETTEAYGNRYRETPVYFTPGMIGVVVSVDVPYVMTPNGRDKSFVLVKFNGAYRTALDYDNIKILP